MSTFVLIPGAGSEAWYWHMVEPALHSPGELATRLHTYAAGG